MGKAQDSVIGQAVNQAAYRATEVAALLGCHASNVTRVQRKGEEEGESN
jgi:hypothetical protein